MGCHCKRNVLRKAHNDLSWRGIFDPPIHRHTVAGARAQISCLLRMGCRWRRGQHCKSCLPGRSCRRPSPYAQEGRPCLRSALATASFTLTAASTVHALRQCKLGVLWMRCMHGICSATADGLVYLEGGATAPLVCRLRGALW